MTLTDPPPPPRNGNGEVQRQIMEAVRKYVLHKVTVIIGIVAAVGGAYPLYDAWQAHRDARLKQIIGETVQPLADRITRLEAQISDLQRWAQAGDNPYAPHWASATIPPVHPIDPPPVTSAATGLDSHKAAHN